MIAICTPSRGLIFSKTVESIMNGMSHLNANGLATKFYTSHDMSIPHGHNYTIAQGMQDGAQRFIIVEEDNYIFPDGFLALATTESPIITMQYNDKNGSPHGIIHYNEAGEIIWGGLGATAVKREVWEKLGEPYFRIDTLYRNTKKKLEDGKLITEYEEVPTTKKFNRETLKWEKKEGVGYKYGGLDIDFYTRARKAGFKIDLVKKHKAHHFELVKLGEKHTNQGCHVIREV